MMRFYEQPHGFYAGIDLHARRLHLCVLDSNGQGMRASGDAGVRPGGAVADAQGGGAVGAVQKPRSLPFAHGRGPCEKGAVRPAAARPRLPRRGLLPDPGRGGLTGPPPCSTRVL
jgi:hypothetical protein